MSFGAFIGGLTQGYQVGQNLQDQKQRREIEQFKLKDLQEEAASKQSVKDLDAAALARSRGVTGPEVQNDVPGVKPDGTIEGVVVPSTPPPQAQVGLPAGVPGQGEGRPSAMEAGGATQASGGVQAPPMETVRLPGVTVRPKPEKPADKQADFLKARMEIATEKGDQKLMSIAQKDYANHLVQASAIKDTEYRERTRELAEKVKTGQLTAEDRQQAIELQKSQMTAMGSVLWLWENGFKDQAIQVSRHAGLGGDGWSLKEFRPGKNGMIEVVGHDGEVAMSFTPEQAKSVRSMSGIGVAEEKVVLGDGASLVGKTSGKTYAENKKDITPEKAGALNSNIVRSDNFVETLLGVKRDTMGNLLAGITPEMERTAGEVKIQAARYIRQGMPPEEAADKAVKEHKAKQAKPAAKGAAPAPTSGVDAAANKLGF